MYVCTCVTKGVIEASNHRGDGGGGGRLSLFGMTDLLPDVRTVGGGLSGVGTIYVTLDFLPSDGLDRGYLFVGEEYGGDCPSKDVLPYWTLLPADTYYVSKYEVSAAVMALADSSTSFFCYDFCINLCKGYIYIYTFACVYIVSLLSTTAEGKAISLLILFSRADSDLFCFAFPLIYLDCSWSFLLFSS